MEYRCSHFYHNQVYVYRLIYFRRRRVFEKLVKWGICRLIIKLEKEQQTRGYNW